jgi:Putative peptidoglycan binding domain
VLGAAVVGGSDGSQDGEAARVGATSLASVARGPLSSQVNESGTLEYAARPDGSPYQVVNQASGAYTALPSAGDVTKCGQVLYRVANEPVALLCGHTPAYRSLYEGMSGPDVQELNRNLVALGYATREELDPSSDYFGSETASALEQMQDKLGMDETGSLDLSQAVFLPGPLRVTKTTATPGAMARPGAPMAQASSTRRLVEVELDASLAAGVEAGDRVHVTLPDNSTTPGIVTRVGTVASSAEGGESGGGSASESSSGTIPVYVSLTRPRDVGRLEQAPVQVQITTARVKDALSVPVTALVARAGGGYAVEIAGADGERRLVSVELGMFDHARGLVQISGSGLSAGQQVVVPAT